MNSAYRTLPFVYEKRKKRIYLHVLHKETRKLAKVWRDVALPFALCDVRGMKDGGADSWQGEGQDLQYPV